MFTKGCSSKSNLKIDPTKKFPALPADILFNKTHFQYAFEIQPRIYNDTGAVKRTNLFPLEVFVCTKAYLHGFVLLQGPALPQKFDPHEPDVHVYFSRFHVDPDVYPAGKLNVSIAPSTSLSRPGNYKCSVNRCSSPRKITRYK